MPSSAFTDQQFVDAWQKFGTAPGVAKHLGIDLRNVQRRRRRVEEKLGIKLTNAGVEGEPVYQLSVPDGIVLVGGDAHIWPGDLTTMQRAFLAFAERLKPAAVIANGDFFDGARVGRHPAIGWERRPLVHQELGAVQAYMDELEERAGSATLIWNLGNHDKRFESRLAQHAPEYENIHGFHLKDHFPAWVPAWRTAINNGEVVVKHRMRGGDHAVWNNVIRAGVSIVTNHLHNGYVRPYTDYRGTRYGVDTGTLAEPDGNQFIDYTEANPLNWRGSFAVLTFRNGRLMYPELVQKWDARHVEWRGDIIKV